MQENIAVKLKDVQITLLLPLWGRAVELQKKKPKLIDNTAAEIISKLDYDFTTIAKIIHPVTQYEWIARSIHMDRTIKEFLKKYPRATIVNIGCGLDTTFNRVDNGSLHWYDLDLPDVIELRKRFIPEEERRQFIACSFLDESWFSRIIVEQNVLFMAAGVLYYFEENQVKDIFDKISEYFHGSEIVFDAASPSGIRAANKRVIQGSGLDEKSFLKWGIQSAADIPKWNDKIEVVKEYPVYKSMMKGQSLKHKLLAFLADYYKIMYMIHLRFN